MKKINGTWIELHHLGLAEGKYFNNEVHNFTEEQWKEKVKEIAELKMKYLVLIGVAFTDDVTETETHYDSKYFKKSNIVKANDPIKAILEEAEKHDMRVFMSVGFFGPWMDVYNNMTNEEVYNKAFKAMDELHEKYGHFKSFYGWYFPDESEISKYFDEHFITYINRYSEHVYQLDKNYKTLIAPYGTCKLVADDYYVSQLKRINVDFIAYQDEVGVKKTTENHTATFYKNLKAAHDKANKSKLWADVEAFTFEGDVYKSALLPANITRLKKQLEAVSPYVDEILIFEYQGMFNAPNSKAYCGADGSIQYYNDYVKLLKETEK